MYIDLLYGISEQILLALKSSAAIEVEHTFSYAIYILRPVIIYSKYNVYCKHPGLKPPKT